MLNLKQIIYVCSLGEYICVIQGTHKVTTYGRQMLFRDKYPSDGNTNNLSCFEWTKSKIWLPGDVTVSLFVYRTERFGFLKVQ